MDSFDDFVAPWLAREPLLAISARFAVTPDTWLARVVLIEELWQTMFGLSQLSIAHNKLIWWAEEAHRCLHSAPTHPLSIKAAGPAQAMMRLCEAALLWLEQAHATDCAQLQALWREFADAASLWVEEGATTSIWPALALKRQLQYHAKVDRYGPSFCDRARLAEFQLRISELADRPKAQPLLSNLLNELAQRLATAASQAGPRSGARAYASFHSEQALAWSSLPTDREFRADTPRLTATLRAWWRARG